MTRKNVREATRMKVIISGRVDNSLVLDTSNQLWDIVAGWCGEIKCGQHSACSGLTWRRNSCRLQSGPKMRNRMKSRHLSILWLLLITLSSWANGNLDLGM